MVKIIHTADLHIDSKMQSNLNREKALERKKEILLTFERMVDFAKKNEVKIIIIAGDMFDSARVTVKSRDRIFNIIKESPTIDFIYLSGNHDEDSFLSQIDDKYSNLKLFSSNWSTFNYGDIDISGVKLQSSNKHVYDTLNLNEDKFNIVVLHGQTLKYNLKDDAEKVNLTKLKDKNINYLALGHIHSFEIDKLDNAGVYCYSGCLEGRGFDECGEKGFVLLEIENKQLNYKFIPFAKRTLHEVKVDISDKNDWFDIERVVMNCVSSIKREDLVKVVLCGKYKLSLEKQIQHLDSKLNDMFYFVKIKDESSLEIDAKDYENDISLKGEFIREVLNSDIKDEEKEKVILIGLKALNGEELS